MSGIERVKKGMSPDRQKVFDQQVEIVSSIFPDASFLGIGSDGTVFDIGENRVCKMLFNRSVGGSGIYEMIGTQCLTNTKSDLSPASVLCIFNNGQGDQHKAIIRENLTDIPEFSFRSVEAGVTDFYSHISSIASDFMLKTDDSAEALDEMIHKIRSSVGPNDLDHPLLNADNIREFFRVASQLEDEYGIFLNDMTPQNFGLANGHLKIRDVSRYDGGDQVSDSVMEIFTIDQLDKALDTLSSKLGLTVKTSDRTFSF